MLRRSTPDEPGSDDPPAWPVPRARAAAAIPGPRSCAPLAGRDAAGAIARPGKFLVGKYLDHIEETGSKRPIARNLTSSRRFDRDRAPDSQTSRLRTVCYEEAGHRHAVRAARAEERRRRSWRIPDRQRVSARDWQSHSRRGRWPSPSTRMAHRSWF